MKNKLPACRQSPTPCAVRYHQACIESTLHQGTAVLAASNLTLRGIAKHSSNRDTVIQKQQPTLLYQNATHQILFVRVRLAALITITITSVVLSNQPLRARRTYLLRAENKTLH
jgi:hypothetical protein